MSEQRKKKILIVHPAGTAAGASQSLLQFVKYLDRTHFDIEIVLARGGLLMEDFNALGLPTHLIPMPLVWELPNTVSGAERLLIIPRKIRNILGFTESPLFSKFLDDHIPDLIHLNDLPLQSAARTAHRHGIPIVWHVRHMLHHSKRSFVQRCMVNNVKRCADVVIGISPYEVEQFGPNLNARVIYNPVDFEIINRSLGTGQAIRRELGLNDDEILICAPIALHRMKGSLDFIRAAAIINKHCPQSVRFLIVGAIPPEKPASLADSISRIGKGHPQNEALRLAQLLGIDNKLQIMGHQTDILSVMDASDIIVYPSRYRNYGRPILEGSALGKPVIVTLPQIRDSIVVHEKTGFIAKDCCPADLAEALIRLIKNQKLRKDMGQQARQYAEANFDAVKCAHQIEAVYEDVLSSYSLK